METTLTITKETVSALVSYSKLSEFNQHLLLRRASFAQLVHAVNVSINLGFDKWLRSYCWNQQFKDVVLELNQIFTNQK